MFLSVICNVKNCGNGTVPDARRDRKESESDSDKPAMPNGCFARLTGHIFGLNFWPTFVNLYIFLFDMYVYNFGMLWTSLGI